jgi:hypothetical protein
MLAVVRQRRAGDTGDGEPAQEDSDIEVVLTTDEPNRVVLHWGVGTAAQRGWHLPPKELWPKGTEKHSGGAHPRAVACDCVRLCNEMQCKCPPPPPPPNPSADARRHALAATFA